MVASAKSGKSIVKSTEKDAQRREKARSHLSAAMATQSTANIGNDQLSEMAVAVEQALYNRWCKAEHDSSSHGPIGGTDFRDYGRVLRMLAANLKRNESLFKGLVSGTIAPQALVVMSAHELATSRQKEERERAKLENSDLAKFASWKEQLMAERRETARKIELQCPVCGAIGAYVSDLPSTTSMAGVGNQKAAAMAMFVCCGITRPVD